jgi:hypothetical protein
MADPLEFSATVFSRSIGEKPSDATLALGDSRIEAKGDGLEIAFEDVFDLRIGPPPKAAREFFRGTILVVGFDRDDEQEVLFVDGNAETLEKVVGLMFRRLLDGLEVAVRYPTRVGGRVTGQDFEIGTLRVAPQEVACTGIEYPCRIKLDSVIDFSRSQRDLLGEERAVIKIQYLNDGLTRSLDLSLQPERKLHLLGRHFRRKFDDLRGAVRQLDVPRAGLRALAKLYTLRGTAKPQSLLTEASASSTTILRQLAEAGLVELNDGQISLTPRGWILVTDGLGAGDNSPADLSP